MTSSARVSSFSCPRCHAPLSPSRFARQIVCPYCAATVRIDETSVDVKRYREALVAWNGADAGGFELGGKRWTVEALVARGEGSDVYRVRSSRWPVELGLVKVARGSSEAAAQRLGHEGELLRSLSRDTQGKLDARAPHLRHHGTLLGGPHPGHAAILYRDEPAFRHTFEAVRAAHPSGVEPRAAIWMWRRILEVLAVLHPLSMAHGAILPPHLLVEDGEHGVRVVGFGCAGPSRQRVAGLDARFGAFTDGVAERSAEQDLRMAARCIAYVLGGDPLSAEVPSRVPSALAERIHHSARDSRADAWALRESLGTLGRELYGPPAFCPLSMP